ncbi:MAG TPA: energy transducer TonB [Patescibacteria group bacterium]|nr:energy transducer TonB [Patescibacteria group bacterium]
MFSDRIFRITFCVSLAIHAFILIKNPNLISFMSHRRPPTVEVNYLKQVPQEKLQVRQEQDTRQQLAKLQSRMGLNKIPPPPFAGRDDLLQIDRGMRLDEASLPKPALIRPDSAAVKKKITLPPLDADKISNPSYISYYQIVREKIRRCAYQNYLSSETGEVYLSFIVGSDGSLREVQLVDSKSSPIEFLRQIAQRSIHEAAPFPAFPRELDYPQLSFNVVISFEIE